MDIVKIGASKGKTVDFMEQVHPSMKKRCQRYIDKCNGPRQVFIHDNKTALEQLDEAFKNLRKFKDQIGLVIDSSTTRGFMKPSQSSLYAQHLGIRNAACFDQVEACNGFLRACETSFYYFSHKEELKDKYILIINNEYPPLTRGLVPKDPNDYKSCASYYVGMTFSFVCTCTLLRKSDNRSWKFYNTTDTIHASHINIPMPQIAKNYIPSTDAYDIILNQEYGQFCLPRFHDPVNRGLETFGYLESEQEFFKNANIIPHTFTQKIWEDLFEYSKCRQVSMYYDKVGNLGSASLPFILHDIYGEDLPAGEVIGFVGAGAGGSGYILGYVHQQQDRPLEEGEIFKVSTKIPNGKKTVYMKMGLRFLLNKILCKGRNRKHYYYPKFPIQGGKKES